MKTWVKVVLGAGLLTILAVVGVSAGGYYWLKGAVNESSALAPAAQKDGRDFGAHATQDGCVDESTRRASACTSLACEVAEKGFLESCFAVATPDPKACNGVPSTDALMDSATWGVAECKRRGHPSSTRCQRILSDLQRLCAR